MSRVQVGTRGRLTFRLGIAALLIAVVGHALVWSGGMLVVPFALAAAVVALVEGWPFRALSIKGRVGFIAATTVLVGVAGELVYVGVR